jgi:iron complex transport system substrate-binding protein
LSARLAALLTVLAIVLAACGSLPSSGTVTSGPASIAPNVTVAPNPTVSPNPTIAPLPTIGPNPQISPIPTLPPAGDTLPPVSPSMIASPAAITYPLTITDDEGTAVTIPARPQKVISLSPANTEIAFTLGAGDRVVGGTDADDFPPEAAALPDVATYNGVLKEKVVSLEPDLVLAAGNGFNHPADIKALRDLGYPVVVVYAKSVDQVLSDIRLIGLALGVPEAAATMTADMEAQIPTVSAAASALVGRPRTFYEIGSGTEIYGPAPDSFISDLIDMAGGDAITTGDPNVFSIPLERLVNADPQVIVVGDALYGVCPRDVEKRAGWKGMTAVKTGDVRPVNDTIVTRPGPRLADGFAALARAIHPEISLPGFPPDTPICASP